MAFGGVRYEDFEKGWALVIGSFGSGHYFRRVGETDTVIATCGLRSVVPAMWHIGTFPPCKRCLKKHGPPTDTRTFVDVERERCARA